MWRCFRVGFHFPPCDGLWGAISFISAFLGHILCWCKSAEVHQLERHPADSHQLRIWPLDQEKKWEWKFIFCVRRVTCWCWLRHLRSFILFNKWDQYPTSKTGIQRVEYFRAFRMTKSCVLHLTDELHIETHSGNRIPNYNVEFTSIFFRIFDWIFSLFRSNGNKNAWISAEDNILLFLLWLLLFIKCFN